MEMDWAVLSEYRYPVVLVTKMTEQMAWVVEGTRPERRVYRDKLVTTMLTEDAAKHLSERMVSAEAEMDRRIQAARAWFNNEQSRLAVAAKEVF